MSKQAESELSKKLEVRGYASLYSFIKGETAYDMDILHIADTADDYIAKLESELEKAQSLLAHLGFKQATLSDEET